MATADVVEKRLSVDQLESADAEDLITSSDKVNDARIESFTPEQQKKIIRRIDRRLVLTLGFMYCIALMDRTNTGNASVAGMTVDLVLIGSRYSIIVFVFFITYVPLQPAATVVLRKIGPRLFLPTICLLWGLVIISSGFVREWTDLIPLRLTLGAFEAGFFPGCTYLLSCWYPRYELHTRYAVFYVIGCLASAFSGILSFGFSQLKDHGHGPHWWGQHYGPTKNDPDAPSGIRKGIAGWRWIFILQSVLTCVIALGGYLLIVDFPEASVHTTFGLKFLNEKERDFVVARIQKDRDDVKVEEFKFWKYIKAGIDLKVWGFASLFGLVAINSYSIAYFLPIILNTGMGFGTAASQCLVAPPYALAAIVMYIFGRLGDKYHLRGPFILLSAVVLLIGLPLVGYVENVGVRYFGVFLATTSCNAAVPCILAWQANNIRGQWKRALCSATLVGVSGIGGIIGSLVFRAQDAPQYRPGILSCMIASALMIVITLAMEMKFYRANKRVDAGGKHIEGLQGFKYTY